MRKYALVNDQDTIIIKSSNKAIVMAYWKGFIDDLQSFCNVLVIDNNKIEVEWLYPDLGYEYIEFVTIL